MALIRRNFFARSVHAVAPDLIGAIVPVRRRRRPHRRGRGLSPHRSGGAQLWRPHRAQRRHVRPARLCLRVSLLRHPLVREFRVRAGRQRERGADPGDRAARRGWRRMRRRRGLRDDAPAVRRARAACARRSASRGRTTACALDAAAVRAAPAGPSRSRSRSAHASASPRRSTCPGATASRARGS